MDTPFILQQPLHIEITSMLCCSEGSIDVHYELAVNKAKATKTLETIVDTVKEATKSGSFGNFTIDPESVKVESESYNIKYNLFKLFAQMTMLSLKMQYVFYRALVTRCHFKMLSY